MSVDIIIRIDQSSLDHGYDPEIFLVDTYPAKELYDHKEIAQKMKNNSPYTITVIIDSLDPKFWNNKKYVEKTQTLKQSLYTGLLYECLFAEFGNLKGNELYTKWLDKYRSVWNQEKRKMSLDEYIIRNEMEPRYRERILKEHRDHEKLFKPQMEISRKRYYHLPPPLNHVDWRNPYDNIFVWEENGKKVFRHGGSGSSGGREINSKYIFGFSLINKTSPIKSYLFLYGDDNELYFIQDFPSLTVPRYDIGENYHLQSEEEKVILSKTSLIEWDDFARLKEVRRM
jgi:hypothetical protein